MISFFLARMAMLTRQLWSGVFLPPTLPKTVFLPDITLAGKPAELRCRRVSDDAFQRFAAIKTSINFVIGSFRILWFCISNAHHPPCHSSNFARRVLSVIAESATIYASIIKFTKPQSLSVGTIQASSPALMPRRTTAGPRYRIAQPACLLRTSPRGNRDR